MYSLQIPIFALPFNCWSSTTPLITVYNHLDILENSTIQRIALPVWKLLLPVMLETKENSKTVLIYNNEK